MYNEEGSVGSLIQSILNQRDFVFSEIIFVLSGCSDKSQDIIKDYSKNDERIKLIVQKSREGKASAINVLLQKLKGDIIIISSADVFLERDCLRKLLLPFKDPKTGMTGAHPLPIGNSNNLVAQLNTIVWELHHRLSLKSPKLGETIAVRKVFDSIPVDCVTDEAYMEALMKSKGYELRYKEDAIVYNRCPAKFRDFFLQRSRVFWGHIDIRNKFGYAVSSMGIWKILPVMATYMMKKPRDIFLLLLLCAVEFSARTSAFYRYYLIKEPVSFIWPKYEK